MYIFIKQLYLQIGFLLIFAITNLTIFTSNILAQTVPILLNVPTIYDEPVIPGQTKVDIEIPVNTFKSMQLEIIAPVSGATLSLIDPTGTIVLSPNDMTVTFLDGSLLSPPLPGGIFQTSTINSPISGDWTVRVEFPPATDKTMIVTTLFAETAYQVGIILDQSEYRVGQAAAIGMIILHNNQPVINLIPTFTIRSPSGSLTNLIGLDNGSIANLDGLMDDGIYSELFTFTEIGIYTINGEVIINGENNTSIKRFASTEIKVVEPLIESIDVNGNISRDTSGCINGVGTQITIHGLQPSTYVVSTQLIDSKGNFIEKNANQDLIAAGQLKFNLFFPSDEILKNSMVDGSYTISEIDILSFQDSGVVLEARQLDAFVFPEIIISELCSPAIAILQEVNVSSSVRNGFIGSLQFSFPVNIATSGSYQITFKVTGEAGKDVKQFGFNQFMSVGRNLVTVHVEHDKLQAIDGPYSIESVLILGQGESAQASFVGSSDNFSKWQFYPHINGDLDADGDVDATDRDILLGFRNQPAITPGDRRDLNGDGLIDLKDARFIMQLICSAGSCQTN